MPYANLKDPLVVQRIYVTQAKHRERNRMRVAEYLATHPCVDCGEADPIVLEFDHVRGEKKFEISQAVGGSTRSWSSIEIEIAKCDVRCANCHRRVTYARYRDSFPGYSHLPVAQLDVASAF